MSIQSETVGHLLHLTKPITSLTIMCVCVAQGGNGGTGNLRLKSQLNNGEQVLLELELKSIADIGVSNAKPCVSSLPFTTHMHWKWYYSEHIADITDIIEGAHDEK